MIHSIVVAGKLFLFLYWGNQACRKHCYMDAKELAGIGFKRYPKGNYITGGSLVISDRSFLSKSILCTPLSHD